MMSDDTFMIRWRGQQRGPLPLESIRQMLERREIGLLHEIYYEAKWITLREFLEAEESRRKEEVARQQEAERLRREEQARRDQQAAARRKAEMAAEEERKNVLIEAATRIENPEAHVPTRPAASPGMRLLGGLIVMAGLGMAGYYFTLFDTSVATEAGMRVNNLGLLNEQRNGIIIGMGLALLGILMTLLGRKSTNE